MEKKNIDWSNLGFGYMETDKRYVATYKDGKWDEGKLISDSYESIYNTGWQNSSVPSGS